MKVKSTFTIMTFAVVALSGLQTVNAQSTRNLASNNATTSSKSSITNAAPLKSTTNNRTRVFIDASGKVGIGTTTPAFTLDKGK